MKTDIVEPKLITRVVKELPEKRIKDTKEPKFLKGTAKQKPEKFPASFYTRPSEDILKEQENIKIKDSGTKITSIDSKEIEAKKRIIQTRIDARTKELERLKNKLEMNRAEDKYDEKLAEIQRRIEELNEQNRLDKSALEYIWTNRLDLFA